MFFKTFNFYLKLFSVKKTKVLKIFITIEIKLNIPYKNKYLLEIYWCI